MSAKKHTNGRPAPTVTYPAAEAAAMETVIEMAVWYRVGGHDTCGSECSTRQGLDAALSRLEEIRS